MTAVDWEEVKRLAADFQRAQLTTTSQTLTESNCVEIINKLIEINLLDVVYTTDGKEYITPQYLIDEIRDELYVNGGRINLVSLAKTLNVDLSHISARVPDVEKAVSGCLVINGQLISKAYQKTISLEINDKLQKTGQVIIGELTKSYDLPSDFLQGVVEKNLGKVIQGKQDKSDPRVFYTDSFVEKNKCILRGALRAFTKPTQISVILNVTQLLERDFYFTFEILSENKESCGVLTATQGINASFIPHIYTKQQNEWVDNFFSQNGYLEYDSITRLGISDPINYVKRHFPGSKLLELPTCVIGSQLLDQIEAAVNETLVSGSFLDTMMLVPSIFDASDVGAILETTLKKQKSKPGAAHILCETVLITETFIQKLIDPFIENGLLIKKAEKSVSDGSYIQSQIDKKIGKAMSRVESSKTEKRDERRKKAAGGKAGGGTQGRETKTKSTKKKYMKGRGDQEDSESEKETTQAKPNTSKLEFINCTEIELELENNKDLQDLIDVEGVIAALAVHLYPCLNKKALELASEAYEKTLISSAGDRKKAHGDLQDRIDAWLMEIRLSERGLKLFPSEDLKSKLSSYLLKSTGVNIVNALFTYASDDPNVHNSSNITAEIRTKILNELSGETKDLLQALNKSMSGSVEEFLIAVEPALLSVGLLHRKPDKKKEKQFMTTKRELLLLEVGRTDDPALLLHVSVLLLFQTATQCVLCASGKFVPNILSFLKPQLTPELFKLLSTFQDLVLKLLTSASEDPKLKSDLNELLPLVKEHVRDYRKPAPDRN